MVSIRPATDSSTSLASAPTSTSPRASERTGTASNPARRTLAGFVPCAESGMITRRRGVATVLVVGPHQQQARHLPARPRRRLQRGPGHARDLAEGPLEPPEELQRSLRRRVGLERVEPLEARQGGDRLGDLRVVLHRAGAERVHPGVEAVVHLCQPRVVANQVHLPHLRQTGALGPSVRRRDRRLRDVERRQAPRSPPGDGTIEDRSAPGRPLAPDRGSGRRHAPPPLPSRRRSRRSAPASSAR